MNFFRKIFGLGPKEPTNVIPRNKPSQINTQEINDIKEFLPSANKDKIYPILISEKLTNEFDLEGEFYGVFYDRENIFSKVGIAHFLIGEVDDYDGTADSFQIRTYNQNEDYYNEIRELGKTNFESFDIPFIDWNVEEKDLNFKILSCRVSYFSSQKIMSQKHMLEAHKLLDAEELLVSIPRRGLIFVCSSDLSTDDYNKFISIHAGIVMQENTGLEYLCEDIFVLKNGIIHKTFYVNELSDMLRKKHS